jgi:glycosidase
MEHGMAMETSVADIDLAQLTQGTAYHPSPGAWEDEVLYFLMLDRFSDGKERGFTDNDGAVVNTGATVPYSDADRANAVGTPDAEARWREAGTKWCGGTLAGLKGKMGYLKRLGVSALWVSPVFKQVAFQETYHGYGIQNFLDVDPHFGTRADLREMVRTAHDYGIRVVLDIILNHSGNVFSYDPDRYWTSDGHGGSFLDPRWDNGSYRVRGFNRADGQPALPFAPLSEGAVQPNDDAIWPRELQQPRTFTCKGRISSWDYDPEFREGDFFDLKDINLGSGALDEYRPSPALKTLCECYKFWIAYADLDGFRVDTVKHMDLGAARYLASVIHEFAQAIGKENFYLIGEITGGRGRAYDTLEVTGLDAALGIDDIPDKLEYLVKGYRNPTDYFDLFRNSLLVNKDSHVWFRNKVVTMFDDHDQVRKGENKARFAADDAQAALTLSALALNATTLGIPCIYYGSEQLFNGHGNSDRYLRECMFGGAFGAFRSHDRHFFREDQWVYRELAKVLALRDEHIALRRGRQYLREISGNGVDYGLPHMIGDQIRFVVPWSRLFDNSEILLAINTDRNEARTAWVLVDYDLHTDGAMLACLYSTKDQDIGRTIRVQSRPDGGRVVRLTVPPAGFVMYA